MVEHLVSVAVYDIWLAAAALAPGALLVGAALAYLLITGLDLREGVAALRAKSPCVAKLLKAMAHAVLFLKVLLS